jgi:hypothetical protein
VKAAASPALKLVIRDELGGQPDTLVRRLKCMPRDGATLGSSTLRCSVPRGTVRVDQKSTWNPKMNIRTLSIACALLGAASLACAAEGATAPASAASAVKHAARATGHAVAKGASAVATGTAHVASEAAASSAVTK